MNQKEVTQEMYWYLGREAKRVLEDRRGAAKINGATDSQINKAIESILAQIERRSF